MTAKLFFPFPIQRTHSTAINEPNWIVTLNKPDDFYTNKPKNPNNNRKHLRRNFPKLELIVSASWHILVIS